MNPASRLLVVDTNVIVSALFVGSAAARKMLGRMLDEASLCFCSGTMAELEAKSRLSKFDRYTSLDFRLKAVESLKQIGLFAQCPNLIRLCRDPKDDIFLALAGSVKADAIISGDKDLLVLGEFAGIPILTPRQWCLLSEGSLE